MLLKNYVITPQVLVHYTLWQSSAVTGYLLLEVTGMRSNTASELGGNRAIVFFCLLVPPYGLYIQHYFL
jgi:hypothetical protein